MKKKENGPARNVTNFASLIKACKGYGTKFDPNRTALSIASMEIQLIAAQKTIKDFNTVTSSCRDSNSQRQIGFNLLGTLNTRILAAVKGTETPKEMVDDVKNVIRKLKGVRVPKKATPAKSTATGLTPATRANTVSVSKSFYQRLELFDQVLALLALNPLYKPNEVDLKITSLQHQADLLSKIHENAVDDEMKLVNSRNTRDHLMYLDVNNLFDVSRGVKGYVRSVYGASSLESKQVGEFVFRPMDKPRSAKPRVAK